MSIVAKKKKKQAPTHTDSMGTVDRSVDTSNFDAYDRAMSTLYGDRGVSAGKALADKFYSTGSLGTLDTNVPGADKTLGGYSDLMSKYANPSADQQMAIEKMKAGLGGYTSQEYQASREQMQRGLNSNLQTNLSNLAKSQARGKVYGAAATAQQQNQMIAAGNQKDQLEQDLMVKNIDEQRSRLSEFGNYSGQVQAQNYQMQSGLQNDYTKAQSDINAQQMEREKINMANRQAEIAGQIGAYTGSGALALSEEQNRAMNRINQQGIRAVK